MKAMRKRVLLKSPVRQFRTPGSVRGLPGNRQSYRDLTLRAFKTELDLNDVQKTACTQHAGAARWAYNWGLARKLEAYRNGEKVPTAIDLHREWFRVSQDSMYRGNRDVMLKHDRHRGVSQIVEAYFW